MKNFFMLCLLFLGVTLREVNAQSEQVQQSDYMVVIGAFAVKENATRLSNQALKLKLKPKIELNAVKNLYYVYVIRTADKDEAILEAAKIRELGKYNDTWVFIKAEAPPKVEEKPIEVVVAEAPAPTPTPEPVVVAPKVLSKEDRIKAEVDKKDMSMKKGNKETLDYIFFYRDASVLRPESRFAVDKLVRILKQNPDEKIRIHGHTNGNDKGKIIRRKDATSDFFSLDNTVEDYGSAKELSEQRANVIRDYLIANGINKDRMSVKAWGGKKPLYPVDDVKAEANVRVEIEVLNED
jgi:outer membrane protein OmpA-like peptidoglycan-associated protein